MIGHMKADGLLDRNWPKGELGDALHAVMCGAGHNLRMTLARLRTLLCALITILAALTYSVVTVPRSAWVVDRIEAN
jgi:transposase, IS5 family